MKEQDQFKQSLLWMLQSGAYREILGCLNGERAEFAFVLRRLYRVHLMRRYIVLREREDETVSRRTNGRWKKMRPIIIDRGKTVIERASGRVVLEPRDSVYRDQSVRERATQRTFAEVTPASQGSRSRCLSR